MSGHYATLLRNTVEAMLPNHDVYITDWADARNVPLARALRSRRLHRLRHQHAASLGQDAHVMAVCQPSVPVMAAVSLMSERDDPLVPKSHDPHGRPHRHALQSHRRQQARREQGRGLVPQQVIMTVPFPLPGMGAWSIRASCS
jgi:poly(3-hydroxybutyrate) depolymerase